MLNYEFEWEQGKDGARILRVYGRTAEVILPEEIAGIPVTAIGAYCFAGQRRNRQSSGEYTFPEDFSVQAESKTKTGECTQAAGLRELAGQAVECVVLPDSVQRIESYAFYQCRELTQISLGNKVQEVGGDAFMNCYKLHHMTVRGEGQIGAGIRQILTQIFSDMEVTFERKNEVFAKLLFPEYYESYDEIAPAHLFSRNIEGEGFRARQCVREGTVDFRMYDTIFPRACTVEREKTVCRLALNRLRYPVDLGKNERELYEAYVRAHVAAVCETAVAAQDEALIYFLCEQGILTAMDIDRCIRLATEQGWAKGAAGFLSAKERFFAPKSVEERYSFDDFL